MTTLEEVIVMMERWILSITVVLVLVVAALAGANAEQAWAGNGQGGERSGGGPAGPGSGQDGDRDGRLGGIICGPGWPVPPPPAMIGNTPKRMELDVNKDGYVDTILFDKNWDGVWDAGWIDVDFDGRFDTIWIDKNSNGWPPRSPDEMIEEFSPFDFSGCV